VKSDGRLAGYKTSRLQLFGLQTVMRDYDELHGSEMGLQQFAEQIPGIR
jgi:hypothetical protein